MSDDAKVQITIAADLDGSVAASADAAKGKLEELGQSGQQAADSFVALGNATESTAAQTDKTTDSLDSLASAATGANEILATLGLTMSAAAMVDFGRGALDYAADIEHMSNVLGISAEDLQAFQYAARQAGVETDDADMILRRFMVSMGQLQDGTGPAVKAIQDLGLTTAELAGDPMVALQRIAIALQGVTDATRRANDEREIFGRTGQELNAMLPLLALGMEEMARQAQNAGQMMSPGVSKAAEDAEIKLSGLWTKLEGRGAEVITGAIDDFNNLTGAIENATKALFGFDNEETTPPKPKPPPQIEDIEMTGDTVRRDADYARDLETFEQKERRKTEIAQQEARRREEIADEEARRQADEASESIADAERTLQAMQRADVQNVNDYIEEQNRRLSEGVSHLDREYQAHEISAQGKHGAEIALTEQIFAEDIKRLDAEIATLTPGTELWREEMKKRADLVAQYNAQIERSNDQLVSEEQQKWTQLGNSIRSSFNSAIDGMLFQGRSFEQGMFQIAEGVAEAFLQMAEKIAEDWIEQQITSMFETRATQGTTSLGQITDAAAVAAANTFASTAAIPVIGPELAPEAAAGAMAQVMG